MKLFVLATLLLAVSAQQVFRPEVGNILPFFDQEQDLVNQNVFNPYETVDQTTVDFKTHFNFDKTVFQRFLRSRFFYRFVQSDIFREFFRFDGLVDYLRDTTVLEFFRDPEFTRTYDYDPTYFVKFLQSPELFRYFETDEFINFFRDFRRGPFRRYLYGDYFVKHVGNEFFTDFLKTSDVSDSFLDFFEEYLPIDKETKEFFPYRRYLLLYLLHDPYFYFHVYQYGRTLPVYTKVFYNFPHLDEIFQNFRYFTGTTTTFTPVDNTQLPVRLNENLYEFIRRIPVEHLTPRLINYYRERFGIPEEYFYYLLKRYNPTFFRQRGTVLPRQFTEEVPKHPYYPVENTVPRTFYPVKNTIPRTFYPVENTVPRTFYPVDNTVPRTFYPVNNEIGGYPFRTNDRFVPFNRYPTTFFPTNRVFPTRYPRNEFYPRSYPTYPVDQFFPTKNTYPYGQTFNYPLVNTPTVTNRFFPFRKDTLINHYPFYVNNFPTDQYSYPRQTVIPYNTRHTRFDVNEVPNYVDYTNYRDVRPYYRTNKLQY